MESLRPHFERIQRETGAHKVLLTALDGCVLQCDLYFIGDNKYTTVQAEFDLGNEEKFAAACQWVRLELEGWLKLSARDMFPAAEAR
jgi:hypothetical protein